MATKRVAVQEKAIEVLANAATDLQALQEELESWRDNMPEGLQGSDKYEQVSDAADALSQASDLNDSANTIEEQVDLLAEGREEVVPCVAHAIGTPCETCGWNGEAAVSKQARSIEIGAWLNEGKPGPHVNAPELTVIGRIGRIGGNAYTYGTPSKQTERNLILAQLRNFPTEAEAVAAFEAAAEAIRAKYPPVAPPLRKAVTPIAALPGADVLRDLTIDVLPLRARASRSDRCDHALGTARAAIDVLETKVDELNGGARDEKEPGESELSPEHAQALDEIKSALEEYERVLDEIEGVEFPGMY